MDDIEFLWSCVKEGKLSKEAALDLLEKRAEIFGDDGGTQAAGARGSRQSRVEKDKAIFCLLVISDIQVSKCAIYILSVG